MKVKPVSITRQSHGLILPIIVGGMSAGALDAALAFYLYGWGVPRFIASGLLGASALHGGTGVWILGLVCHFSIMLIVAALYGLASLGLPFIRTNYIVCGIACGIADFLVMNLVVLPLSADPGHIGPFKVSFLIHGIIETIITTGLPISLSFHYFSAPATEPGASSAYTVSTGST